MTDKKKILFVDDEPRVLTGLKRSLHGQRNEWDMHFTESAAKALELIGNQRFDVIVTDMRMPGMDGAELLERVSGLQPNLLRLILSGHSDEDMIIRAAASAHQFLTKPSDSTKLKATLQNFFDFERLIGDSTMIGQMASIRRLPSLPELYVKIEKLLQSEQVTVTEIADLISQDLGMTSKILQLVNSAFFGLGRHVTDAREAVMLIGMDALKALVLSIGVFQQFDQDCVADLYFDYEKLLDHSLQTARLSARIAEFEGMSKSLVDDCFLAGLLHDIGYLIIEQNFSDKVSELSALVETESLHWEEAEKRVFGTTHGPIGAYLLGLWALPSAVVEAVAFHHNPSASSCTSMSPLTIVHAANVLVNLHGEDAGKPSAQDHQVDQNFLERIGVLDRLDSWKALMTGDKKND